MSFAGAAAADEDTWQTPDAWRELIHPRRDRPCRPEARIDAAAPREARALVEAARPLIDAVLALPGTSPAMAERTRAHLNGEPDPLGAAVVAAVTS